MQISQHGILDALKSSTPWLKPLFEDSLRQALCHTIVEDNCDETSESYRFIVRVADFEKIISIAWIDAVITDRKSQLCTVSYELFACGSCECFQWPPTNPDKAEAQIPPRDSWEWAMGGVAETLKVTGYAEFSWHLVKSTAYDLNESRFLSVREITVDSVIECREVEE